MVFDSKTGQILAADTMPDGKESYMSPVCFAQPGSDLMQIVFGSGGETISGSLYIVGLADLMANDISGAKVLVSETGHGFIASPVIADISGDGFYDIVTISHASGITAIDGITGEKFGKPIFQAQSPAIVSRWAILPVIRYRIFSLLSAKVYGPAVLLQYKLCLMAKTGTLFTRIP